ncbi:UDP-4-amino-4,6-dideoxy-N-acetyl-beta-L-altrosamine transaminase [Agarivorans aestuarii]|uniref:UDP-4-amino-4, 6-dideoxy-N-acetyl-beta-L-altrosamine transaminase n=1 Tax=Agarivorans aestuarii TaxID=1563703 RepID=A0ABU7G0G3_9ALTE|nr:UDP-4-amino-4,6-dideoxy-N-acetyl-beta-L-altrosamine transaminase [Agarivorans aestuarii]MEE1672897.1 UDP-4-amino-4,6-dideoxy-N-acetyl-beta-L-altrosamine transaminase [Agarivorans aestuarii]
MIPYGKQNISEQDIEAVVEVLRSDYLTQGPCVPEFEKALCELSRAEYALATNSATSALHIACKALEVGNGDIVWTSPITFVASANCALYCGAKVDFVDINPDTFNLCPKALEQKLEQAKRQGKLPKVLIAVHMCGQPCDMQVISALGKQYNFKIIEDASHAIGGRYLNENIGNCNHSDITVFSFHPVKIITTGEGGAALTNAPELHKKMLLLRSHGVTRDPQLMDQAPDGDWYYQQVDLGFNYRMTDLQAALGTSQLRKISPWIEQRQKLAQRYTTGLSQLPLDLPFELEEASSAWHLYVIRLHDASKRKQLFAHLRQNKINVNVHYIPVHLHPYYQALGFQVGDFPVAENYYHRAISLPLYPGLSDSQQDYVMHSLAEGLR